MKDPVASGNDSFGDREIVIDPVSYQLPALHLIYQLPKR